MFCTNTTEVILCPSQCTILGVHDGGGSFFHLGKVVPARFLHCKVSIFPFVLNDYLMEGDTMHISVTHYSLVRNFTIHWRVLPATIITVVVARW